jgi:hypothetical protein
MKFNSRLLIGELCAAGAAAVCTTVLVVGCTTGERTGRFWNPGDVGSSDAYAQAELARDRAVVASASATPGAPSKVAPASGTQDGSGSHVTIPDQADTPPPPLTPPESPTIAPTLPADPAAANAGRASGTAQATGVAVGSAQLAGPDIPGTVVAPYVQKVAPSGAIDNSRHDFEIVKPKQVLAQQLDPFAATDAKPFPAPSNATASEATRAVAPVDAPASSHSKSAVASAHSSSSDVPPPIPTGAALPPAEVSPHIVSRDVSAARGTSAPQPAVAAPVTAPIITAAPAAAPTTAIAAPSPAILTITAPSVTVPSATAPAAVVTQTPSVTPASASPAAVEEFDPTLASQPTPAAAATPEPAASASPTASAAPEASVAEPVATSSAPPMELESPGEPTVVVPMRPHPGVKPADESLNEDDAAKHAAASPLVQPAGSQVTPPTQPSGPANTYEAEGHGNATGHPCVTPPAPPSAGATAPPQPRPANDTWESTKTSKPPVAPSRNLAPAPLATAAPAPVSAPAHLRPAELSSPPSVAPVSTAPVLPDADSQPITHSSAAHEASSHVAPPAVSDAELLRALPTTATSETPKSGEPAMINVVSDPMICDSGSIHGRYTGDDSRPTASPSHPVDDRLSHKAPAKLPAAPIAHPAAKTSAHSIEGKTTSFWDDGLSAPAGKPTIATADFSVPAPPPPEDFPSSDSPAKAAGSQLALAVTGADSGSPAWLAMALVAGLGLSVVVWRRWRRGDESQAG